jgi:hypothetical protein
MRQSVTKKYRVSDWSKIYVTARNTGKLSHWIQGYVTVYSIEKLSGVKVM